jgi:hypothetical protein
MNLIDLWNAIYLIGGYLTHFGLQITRKIYLNKDDEHLWQSRIEQINK